MELQVPEQFAPVFDLFNDPLFTLGGTEVTLFSVVTFALFIVLAFLASWGIQAVISRTLKRRGVEEGVRYAIRRLVHYAVIALGLFLAIENLGVSITGLAAFGAILGVGIGFGLQNIAQNFVSGLILLLERPVKRGDFVLVGDVRGTVRDIRARATVVTTLDNMDILVPNSHLINEEVVNQTFGDRRLRGRVDVGVAYGSDVDLVRELLRQAAAEQEEVLEDPEPTVRFLDFGDSALEFVVYFMIANPRRLVPVESDVRFTIDRLFRENGVEIPFPQRDLHLRSGLERLPGGGPAEPAA